ncbi:TetR/AcrR family transcriptional regulator [Nocardioides sp. NPDC087217]|uniref:TetR/AcrR family transcriptional regulator n=1 Tax=Nocardioides sp. NPDC087217 TaxID=3364335 RepID=UPI00380C4327
MVRREPRAASGGAAETKSARTRTRILDAAAKVLSVKGYSGMRLSDVAKEADLQAPAIYYYFDSREDLIEEVMWVGIANMREHIVKVLDDVPSGVAPLDRILVAVEEHLRHELEISDYTTASIRNAGQVPERIRNRQIAEEARYGEVWSGLIRQAAEEGQLRPDLDLFISQMLVLGSLNWTAEWWNPKRGSIDVVVKNAQSFVRHAIGA